MELNPDTSGFFVKPIRELETGNYLQYDTSRGEITWAAGAGGTGPTGPAASPATPAYAVLGLSGDMSLNFGNFNVFPNFNENNDPNGWWDSTNKWFKPTIPGYYYASWQAAVDCSGTGGSGNNMNVQIWKNNNTSGTVSISQAPGGILGLETPPPRISFTLHTDAFVYMNGTTDVLYFSVLSNEATTLHSGAVWTNVKIFQAAVGAGPTGPTGPAGSVNAGTTGYGNLVVYQGSGPTGTVAYSSSVTIDASGHLLPTTSYTYDLGSTGAYWRDIYLSSGTIHLGPTGTISADGTGNLQLNVGNGGYVSVGKSTPPAQAASNYGLDVSGFIDGTVISATSGAVLNLRRENPSNPNNGVSSGDILGQVRFLGKDASGNYNDTAPALIRGIAADTFTSTNMPTYLTFATNPANAGIGNRERMRIDPSGNVGIGTTSPAATFDVSGRLYAGVSGAGVVSLTGAGGVSYIQTGLNRSGVDPSANKLVFSAIGSTNETMTVDVSNQRVGVGTTSPAAEFDVSGRAYIGSSGSGVVSVVGVGGNTYIQSGLIPNNSSLNNKLIFTNVNATKVVMAIDMSEQRVGVGTTTPAATLDVNGTMRSTSISLNTNAQLTSTAPGNLTITNGSSSGTVYDSFFNPPFANSVQIGNASIDSQELQTDVNLSGIPSTRIYMINIKMTYNEPATTATIAQITIQNGNATSILLAGNIIAGQEITYTTVFQLTASGTNFVQIQSPDLEPIVGSCKVFIYY